MSHGIPSIEDQWNDLVELTGSEEEAAAAVREAERMIEEDGGGGD